VLIVCSFEMSSKTHLVSLSSKTNLVSLNRFNSSAQFLCWLRRRSKEAYQFHQTLPNYQKTPFTELPKIASLLGVSKVHIKDEGKRFGLKSFKSLGSSFAVHKLNLPPGSIVTSMTDGNHGRGLAWVAKNAGFGCVIFVPENVSGPRIEAMEDLGATVKKISGNYDEAIETVKKEASENGWHLVADSSWPGYIDICADICAGYTTIFSEIPDEYDPTHVIVCGGVGGLASAGAHYTYEKRYLRQASDPILICIEPNRADCLLQSAHAGKLIENNPHGDMDSIMQGLNCGTPSLVSWSALEDTVDHFVGIEDQFAIDAVRHLYDSGIVSGESGGAGLAGLLGLTSKQRIKVGLDENSRVLLINTEADTDPNLFQKIIKAKL